MMATERRVLKGDAAIARGIAAAFVVACTLLAASIVAGAGNCGAWFAMPMLCQSSSAIPAAAAVAVLPFVTWLVIQSPLAAFFALYIVLVPLDDALLIGQSLTVPKILGLVVGVIAVGRLIKTRAHIRVPYAILGWVGVLAYMALSVFWGIDPESSASQLATLFSAFVLMFVIVAVPKTRFEVRAIIIATVLSGAVVGIVSIVLARNELSNVAGQVGRLYLTFGSSTLDPNRFGAALLLPLAMAMGVVTQTRGRWRVGALLCLVLTLTAIYLSASRGTILGIIAMSIVAILASRHRIALGSLLAAGVGLLLVVPSEITRRLFSEGTIASGAGRLDIWRVAIEIFRTHWLIGTGVGTFIPAYNSALFLAYEPQFAGWSRDPHSLLLSTATELGLVGVAIMLVNLVLQYSSARLIGADHPYSWLRTVFRAALIGLLVDSLFVDMLSTKSAWLLFTEMLIFASIAVRPSAQRS